MKVLAREMRAKVIEAEVPHAMAKRSMLVIWELWIAAR